MLPTTRASMSERGQSRPNPIFWAMSGLPPVATELRTSEIGSFVPEGDIGRFGHDLGRTKYWIMLVVI